MERNTRRNYGVMRDLGLWNVDKDVATPLQQAVQGLFGKSGRIWTHWNTGHQASSWAVKCMLLQLQGFWTLREDVHSMQQERKRVH